MKERTTRGPPGDEPARARASGRRLDRALHAGVGAMPLLLAGPGWAEPSPFQAAWDAAEPIEALGRFLGATVGRCAGLEGSAIRRCRADADRARAEASGAVRALRVTRPRGLLGTPSFDPERGRWRVRLTPIFSAEGLGLTVGRPLRLDREGRPVVRTIDLWVDKPSGLPDFVFRRDVERGIVRLQVLVKLGEPWALKRRGRAPARGLSTRLVGYRLTHRSTVLGERLLGKRRR